MSVRGQLGSMSFRRRVVLLAAGAVAAAVVIASIVVYVLTRSELRGQIDASLRQKLTPGKPQAVQVRTEIAKAGKGTKGEASSRTITKFGVSATQGGSALVVGPVPVTASGGVTAPAHGQRKSAIPNFGARGGPPGANVLQAGPGTLAGGDLPFAEIARGTRGADGQRTVRVVLPTQKLGGAPGYAQFVQSDGQVLRSEGPGGGVGLAVTAATRAVATGHRPGFFSDATIAGTHVRVLTQRDPLGAGVWQVALPLTDVDSTLARLELILAAVSLGGVALAAALGLLVSRAALLPVRRLTGAAERVARTQDLGHRIRAGEEGELGRLAASFNTMLAALERSRLAQRQLVSDASHELRTPLTSIQANLDALAIGARLRERDRARVVAAARAQLSELTVLVGDLVDLSKTSVDEVEVEAVRLDLAAAGAAERARVHAPRCVFTLDAEPCLVRAAPARLDRAIANLLDNAVKWGPPEGPVEVRVRDGHLEVRDHGPGIAEDDLPRIFDRFYRAPAARGLPGSGLGLAIVRQVAETHGGSVHAANDPEQGARLSIELPVLRMTAAESAASCGVRAAATESHRAPTAGGVQQVPPVL